MPSAGKNRLLWTTAAVVIFTAATLIALPYIASTRIVADRIAAELGAVTGYRVTLGAPPKIDVWPSFRTRLTDVRLTEGAGDSESPVLTAEELTATLDPWSALRGVIGFRAITLVRPAATFSAGGTGSGLRPLLHGLELLREKAGSHFAPSPDGKARGAGNLGLVTVVDGKVASGDGDAYAINNIEAVFAWPRSSAPARLTGTALWRGETVTYSVEAADGLAFLSGEHAALDLSITSARGSITFGGAAEMDTPLLASGDLRVTSPSLKKALEWADGPAIAMAPAGEFALQAKVTSAAARTKLDDVELSMDGSVGKGAVEIDLGADAPSMVGTLAFAELDFTPFVPAAAATTLKAAGSMPAVETGFSGPFVVDLRLSADRAMLGPVLLSKAAATLNIRPELAAFDVSEAVALGGVVQAGFRASGDGGAAEISLYGTDIDAGQLADIFGMTRFRPSGKATVAAMIKGPASDWRRLIENGDGSISLKLANGSISDFDLDRFAERVAAGGFFGLEEAGGADLPVEDAEIRLAIGGKLARIEKCRINSPLAEISLGGIAPLPGRGLALSGVSRDKAKADAAALRFFVGGSWTLPFFSSATARGPQQ